MHWIFMTLLGLLTATIGILVEVSVGKLVQGKRVISGKKALTDESIMSYGYGYLLWVTLCVGFTMFAAAMGSYVSRDVEGSGIPELKSILAGVNIYKYLSF
jgi:H+/Cl- antiporter ClcA